MNLCHHLNGLVTAVRNLGSIESHAAARRQNPSSCVIYIAKLSTICMVVTATFLIGKKNVNLVTFRLSYTGCPT